MNVSPINATYCKPKNYLLKEVTQQTTQNEPIQPSFKGLWGETSNKFELISNVLSYDCYEHHYYPFFDETKSQINKALISKTSIEEIPAGRNYPEAEKYVINKAVVKDVLPLAECEWKQYVKNKFGMLEMHKNYIEDVLKKFNLTKYISK